MQPLIPLHQPPAPEATGAAPVRQHGFTLVELLVTIAILGVLTALAAPSFTPLIERWRVRQAAEDLTSSMFFARSEAIKRGGGITLETASTWDQGWSVRHTSSSDPLQQLSARTKLVLSQSASLTKLYIDRWGMLSDTDGGAPADLEFLIKPTGKADTAPSAIRLCVTKGGRIAQKKDGGSC